MTNIIMLITYSLALLLALAAERDRRKAALQEQKMLVTEGQASTEPTWTGIAAILELAVQHQQAATAGWQQTSEILHQASGNLATAILISKDATRDLRFAQTDIGRCNVILQGRPDLADPLRLN